jgi:hypothetical protein
LEIRKGRAWSITKPFHKEYWKQKEGGLDYSPRPFINNIGNKKREVLVNHQDLP